MWRWIVAVEVIIELREVTPTPTPTQITRTNQDNDICRDKWDWVVNEGRKGCHKMEKQERQRGRGQVDDF